MNKKILIACEFSGVVRDAFNNIGYDAISCDILPSETPGKHLQIDLIKLLYQTSIKFDAVIAFPPCTHLAVSGARYFKIKKNNGEQQNAIDFFMKIVNANIKYIAIENPIGIMSSVYKKPNQIIHPYYFGDPARKKTCLWLKNLPLLYHNKEKNLFDANITHTNQGIIKNGYPVWMFNNNKKHRSKTFQGIANAMALQWGKYINEH